MSSLTPKSTSDHVLVDAQEYLWSCPRWRPKVLGNVYWLEEEGGKGNTGRRSYWLWGFHRANRARKSKDKVAWAWARQRPAWRGASLRCKSTKHEEACVFPQRPGGRRLIRFQATMGGGARRRLRLREGLPRPPSPHPKSHGRGADHQQGDDPASCRSSLWSVFKRLRKVPKQTIIFSYFNFKEHSMWDKDKKWAPMV